MTLKVLTICTSEADLALLKAPDPDNSSLVFSAQVGSVESVASVLQKDPPDVLLLDLPNPDEHAMAMIESALVIAPATHTVLVSPDRSVEFLLRAMRAGVREVLPAPLTLATVRQVIKHAQGYPLLNGRRPSSTGQVLAMVQAKGGSGATFLATNLAYALSLQNKRVALIDLNLYFGDAAMFLGNGSALYSVVDLARQAHRMDSTLLESCMFKFSDNLHVLAAPESPENINEVTTIGLEKIIDIARNRYDFVILDLSSMLGPVSIKALDLADSIHLVVQLSLPFIRAAKLMVGVFRALGYASSKLHVVVNRFEKTGDIGLADVEKATTLKVQRTIANSHNAANSSVNQGVPMVQLFPKNPVSLALQDWAEELAPAQAPVSKGWLRGLMRFAT
ncbi:MAG: AAA family ATPase [Burkholderiales bacterium]|nr:AAA family ATPase [Burkholderiales bacterium]